MITPQNGVRRRYGLFVVAIVVLAFGGVAFATGRHSFAVRSLGALACIVSVYLVRISNVHTGSNASLTTDSKVPRRVGPLAWILTALSLAACGATYLLMYLDALHGGKEAWPVDAFAAAAVALAVTSGYVAMKLFG